MPTKTAPPPRRIVPGSTINKKSGLEPGGTCVERPLPPPESEILVHLRKPSEFDRLLKSLPIHQETIIEIACAQPQLFVEAARLRVQTKQKLMRAEAKLDEVEAFTAKDIRERADARGQKMSVDAVKSAVAISDEVLDAQKTVRMAAAEEEFGMNMLEAFRHRRDMIKVIADLVRVEGNDPAGSIRQFNENLGKTARASLRAQRALDD